MLSTIMYPEIYGANYLYCSFNENSIINKVNEILKMSIPELKKYSYNNDFLNKNVSLDAWIKAFKAIEMYR